MKKKNKQKYLSLITCFGLMIAIICIIAISNTYARYVTSATGVDSATIAKWAWKIGKNDLNSNTTTYTLNLFDTIRDGDGSSEDDVRTGKIIAPGTSGSFDIKITNNSDVNANYSVTFTQTGVDGVNIEYSTDGNNWGNISSLNVSETKINMNSTVTIPIKWRWAFESGTNSSAKAARDVADTAIGFAATSSSNVEVNALLTVVQAD